jgi:hypothetical protein
MPMEGVGIYLWFVKLSSEIKKILKIESSDSFYLNMVLCCISGYLYVSSVVILSLVMFK